MSPGFRAGVKDGLPICFGYLSVAFAFGIYAVSSGLSIPEVVLISLLNVTSAGQLAGVPIFLGGGYLEMALTQFVINLRYALMSVTLSQRLDDTVRPADRFAIAFVNTDEVFAVASSQPERVGRAYLYGLILPPYLGWGLGTLLGAVAGDILPAVVTTALSVAIYGMFVAIVLPPARAEKPVALCVLTAVALGCLFHFLPALSGVPAGFVIIIGAVAASALFAAVAPLDLSGEGGAADDPS